MDAVILLPVGILGIWFALMMYFQNRRIIRLLEKLAKVKRDELTRDIAHRPPQPAAEAYVFPSSQKEETEK